MELEQRGLSVRIPNGIHLPASDSHEELEEALLKLLPEPFKYVKDELTSTKAAGWLICTKEAGCHQMYSVSSKHFPSGSDLDLCTETNCTGFWQHFVILSEFL